VAALIIMSLMLILEPLVFATNRLVRRRRRSVRRHLPDAPPRAAAAGLGSESRVAADLVAGRIDAATYRTEMQAIAQAEDLRRPLLVPGEGGSDVS
jgi:hypothetical protein